MKDDRRRLRATCREAALRVGPVCSILYAPFLRYHDTTRDFLAFSR